MDIINDIFNSLSIDKFYEGMENTLAVDLFTPRQKRLLIYMGSGITESYTKAITDCKALVEKGLAKLDGKIDEINCVLLIEIRNYLALLL